MVWLNYTLHISRGVDMYILSLFNIRPLISALLYKINQIQLFQKMLSGRTTNVNCRTAIARLKRNVGIEY